MELAPQSKQYYRLMLGAKSVFAAECFAGNFVGADFGIEQDLTNELPEKWREFNKKFRPVYLAKFTDKTKIAAGLACGALWRVCKEMRKGAVLLCPDGSGTYRVGVIDGDYQYHPGEILPHRRPVNWLDTTIDRSDMSDALRNSTGSIGTVSEITKYASELEQLLLGCVPTEEEQIDETVEDPVVFGLEKHLEEFLVKNWQQTELGKNYDIYEVDGEVVGQQFLTDTGPLDILAISKDKKELLVVELKKGRASDAVVGQIQRYMGYVMEFEAEKGQTVRGIIIALDDDLRIRRSLSVAPNIEFYRYQVSFELFKA